MINSSNTSNNASIDNSEWLICYDFDETISLKHVFGYLNSRGVKPGESASLIDECFEYGGLKNPEETKASMQMALKNGHKVAVTTFTLYPEIVKPYLLKLGLTEEEVAQIKVIGGFPTSRGTIDLGTTTCQPYGPAGKLLHVEQAKKEFNITHNNVALVDDSQNNVNICNENNIKGIKVPRDEYEMRWYGTDYFNELNELIKNPVVEVSVQQKEAELQKQKEAELQKQKEAELQKQKEAALQKQKEAALQKQKEAELQRKNKALRQQQLDAIFRQFQLDKQQKQAAELRKQQELKAKLVQVNKRPLPPLPVNNANEQKENQLRKQNLDTIQQLLAERGMPKLDSYNAYCELGLGCMKIDERLSQTKLSSQEIASLHNQKVNLLLKRIEIAKASAHTWNDNFNGMLGKYTIDVELPELQNQLENTLADQEKASLKEKEAIQKQIMEDQAFCKLIEQEEDHAQEALLNYYSMQRNNVNKVININAVNNTNKTYCRK